MGVEIVPQPEERAEGEGATRRPSATRAGSRPNLRSNEEAIELILEAIEKAGYKPGRDIGLALDFARQRVLRKNGKYVFRSPTGEA